MADARASLRGAWAGSRKHGLVGHMQRGVLSRRALGGPRSSSHPGLVSGAQRIALAHAAPQPGVPHSERVAR